MNGFNLQEKEAEIQELLPKMFDALLSIRPADEKSRTGIQCCIKEPHSRNIIMPKAYQPSPVALHFCSEKIVRAYEHRYYSSRVNADPKKFEFAGGLIYKDGDIELHSGTSGMTEDEDEMISFVNLTRVLKQSPGDVFGMIYPTKKDVPECVFNTNGYIWKTLLSFCYY
ncbi:MAG: hypothetical protein WCJ39_07670 [bacterium]